MARFNGLNAELLGSGPRERLRDAQSLTRRPRKRRSTLEATAVAQAINQSPSVVRWNSQLLLEPLRALPPTAMPAGWRDQIRSISREAERLLATIQTMRSLLRTPQTAPASRPRPRWRAPELVAAVWGLSVVRTTMENHGAQRGRGRTVRGGARVSL